MPAQAARARCTKCEHVFLVGPEPPEPSTARPAPGPRLRQVGTNSENWELGVASLSGQGPVSADPFFQRAKSRPENRSEPEPSQAVLAARIRLAKRDHGDRPMLISHGFGLGEAVPHGQESPVPEAASDALLSLSEDDVRAIAEDLVQAVATVYADRVATARRDQHWDAHLGAVIRDAWSDFQACVGTAEARDEYFRAALNHILAEGRSIF